MKTPSSVLVGMSLVLVLASFWVASPAGAAPLLSTATAPIVNSITVHAQDTDSGQVVVDSVTAAQVGWLLIRNDAHGRPGTLLGFAPVRQGSNTHVVVDINRVDTSDNNLVTPTLWATLVADPNALTPFATPDSGITQQPSLARATFSSTLAGGAPVAPGTGRIVIRAQDVNNGRVVVDSVTAGQVGWVLIRSDKNGSPGLVIGYAPVRRGLNTRVVVNVNPTDRLRRNTITPTLWATLVTDPNALTPFASPGSGIGELPSAAVVPFSSTLAVGTPVAPGAGKIVVRAQDTNSGQVVVDSVTAGQVGWVLIRSDDDGRPGLVIGFAPVRQGLNTHVVVDVNPTDQYGNDTITQTLWATLVADPNALTPFATPDPGVGNLPSAAVVPFSSTLD